MYQHSINQLKITPIPTSGTSTNHQYKALPMILFNKVSLDNNQDMISGISKDPPLTPKSGHSIEISQVLQMCYRIFWDIIYKV